MIARRRRRVRPVAAAIVLLTLLLAALVNSTTPAAAAPDRLPPADYQALARLFRAEVKPLGLKVTRAMLQNLETYERDPEGTHLALYVEPRTAGYTSADYVRNFTRLTRRFLPKVFQRWRGLESFDICQEPLGDLREDPREDPPPVTQIFVTRGALDRVADWRRATLAELLAAAPRGVRIRQEYYVYFAPTVRQDPAFVKAAEQVGWSAAPDNPWR